MGSPHELKTTVIALYATSCFMVMLRCITRTLIVKAFRYDDWLMVATQVVYTFYSAFVLCGVHYGTGRHLVDLTPQNALTAKKYWYLCELTYIMTTTLLKLAIASFLLRIAVERWHVRGLKILMGAVGVFGVFYLFFGIFQCVPIKKFWLPHTHGFCFSGTQIAISSYAHSTLSAGADWYCGILPIFMVWHTTLSKRMKTIVACILAIGSIGSIASLVRYAYIGGFEGDDFLYSTSNLAIWSTIEVGIGVIAGSMATFRPLLRIILGKVHLSVGDSSERSERSRKASIPLSGNAYIRTGGPKDATMTNTTLFTSDDSPPESLGGDKGLRLPVFVTRPLAAFDRKGGSS